MMIGTLCLHFMKKRTRYPLTTKEIAEAQRKDQELKVNFKENAKMPQRICVINLLGACRNLFLFLLAIVPNLDSLKIGSRFVFLKGK